MACSARELCTCLAEGRPSCASTAGRRCSRIALRHLPAAAQPRRRRAMREHRHPGRRRAEGLPSARHVRILQALHAMLQPGRRQADGRVLDRLVRDKPANPPVHVQGLLPEGQSTEGQVRPKLIIPANAQASFNNDDGRCGGNELCAPTENLNPTYLPPTCAASTLFGGDYCNTRNGCVCISDCVEFGFLASLATEQGTCARNSTCVPCEKMAAPPAPPAAPTPRGSARDARPARATARYRARDLSPRVQDRLPRGKFEIALHARASHRSRFGPRPPCGTGAS